ncbi:hypothetical protein [Leucobacter sp. M11]|uniref:hypothetical protein n=1 Tax=Leucobacter sp. M11 TaxID=2993565 RepID=UPI002D80BE1E|nr:hypothetical protein [Leucobacter sp. M11]MEB4613856.1 hypothetical protein [Leucobacter sp. M11]
MTDYQNDETAARNQRMLPWLITATVSVIAIITAMVFVTLVKAADQVESELGAGQTQSPAPETSETPKPAETPDPEESEKPTEESTEVPKVEVGPTGNTVIAPWGVSLDLSTQLGYTRWSIPSGEELLFEFPLAQELPDSCSASRTGWGFARVDQAVPGSYAAGGQHYTLLKPAACSADKKLYDQLWGLTDAAMRSIKPV